MDNLLLPTVALAERLHKIIKPSVGTAEAAAIVGEANSGDYTYALDQKAEDSIAELVSRLGSEYNLRFAFYSEDKGLVEVHSNPQYVFVVDPIDGTRPAICGFESCCVSVALAPVDAPTLGNVVAGCLVEIQSGNMLYGKQYAGLRRHLAQLPPPSRRSDTDAVIEIGKMFWATEMCGRPVQAIDAVLGELINVSSLKAACFVFNSSSFAISRVVLGQLDAYVDFYAALLRRTNAEKWEQLSRTLFSGKVFGLFPYDIAAAAFLAREAGMFVSDAFGQPLNSMNLLDSSSKAISSAVVAANAKLGSEILRFIERGFTRADQLQF